MRRLVLRYLLTVAEFDERYYSSAKTTAEIRHRAAIRKQRILRTKLANLEFPAPKGVRV